MQNKNMFSPYQIKAVPELQKEIENYLKNNPHTFEEKLTEQDYTYINKLFSNLINNTPQLSKNKESDNMFFYQINPSKKDSTKTTPMQNKEQNNVNKNLQEAVRKFENMFNVPTDKQKTNAQNDPCIDKKVNCSKGQNCDDCMQKLYPDVIKRNENHQFYTNARTPVCKSETHIPMEELQKMVEEEFNALYGDVKIDDLYHEKKLDKNLEQKYYMDDYYQDEEYDTYTKEPMTKTNKAPYFMDKNIGKYYFELPGYKKENIHVKYSGRKVHIYAVRKDIRGEVIFERSITVKDVFDMQSISMEFVDGVLIISFSLITESVENFVKVKFK